MGRFFPSGFSRVVEGEGFEPSKAEPADLQSAPFDRSGTPPTKPLSLAISIPRSQTKGHKSRENRSSGRAGRVCPLNCPLFPALTHLERTPVKPDPCRR